MKKIYFFILALSFTSLAFGQRYCADSFDEVNVESNVVYGNNISILTGAPAAKDLVFDVYTPANDDATDRPVVLVAHTGSFLPIYFNKQATGSKTDSSVVEICMTLAKKGFVAIPYDYRLGWLPTAEDADVRKSTIIQAAYRGIQDTRTAIRFLKKSAAENSNPYGIDPTRIAVWGLGTGSYLSMGAATLDDVAEITLAKFIDSNTALPYVHPSVLGDMFGTSTGTHPVNGAILCTPNHEGYSSDFQLCVSMGGALGDAEWINGVATPPMIGVHCPTDNFAPYHTGDVLVPTTGALVISDALGVRGATELANLAGSNDAYTITSTDDPMAVANEAYANTMIDVGGTMMPFTTDNFYPFKTSNPKEGAPWAWWDENVVTGSVAYLNATFMAELDAAAIHQGGLITNPNMSATKARAYIDSTMMLVLPRMSVTFGLGCVSTDVEILDAATVGLEIFPNPATVSVNFKTNDDSPIQSLFIYDMSGRLVKAIADLNTNTYTMNRSSLPNGIYVAKLNMIEGVTTQKIVLQ